MVANATYPHSKYDRDTIPRVQLAMWNAWCGCEHDLNCILSAALNWAAFDNCNSFTEILSPDSLLFVLLRHHILAHLMIWIKKKFFPGPLWNVA